MESKNTKTKTKQPKTTKNIIKLVLTTRKEARAFSIRDKSMIKG